MECSYCGKLIYADSPRCPKCGNYTDGLGPRARADGSSGRQIPKVFIVAGVLVIVAMLLPLILAVLDKLK